MIEQNVKGMCCTSQSRPRGSLWIPGPQALSGPGLQPERNRSVVRQPDLHMRAKNTSLYRHHALPGPRHKVLEQTLA